MIILFSFQPASFEDNHAIVIESLHLESGTVPFKGIRAHAIGAF